LRAAVEVDLFLYLARKLFLLYRHLPLVTRKTIFSSGPADKIFCVLELCSFCNVTISLALILICYTNQCSVSLPQAAIRLEEPAAKVNHIKSQQEECELKLEKERDAWAAQMLELIAKEDEIVSCIRDYVLNQRIGEM